MSREDFDKRNITVFGPETHFDGELHFKDRLVITGYFSGKIISETGDLEISKNAVCEVEKIESNSIVVSGSVKGDLSAKERVEMCSGSSVEGNVKTARIRISNNVDFKGEISMLEEESDVDLFAVASAEYKQAMIVHSDIVK